ncbi:MAG: hypothetical protein SGCHY_005276, partial [Lobulomycetales sp.]
MLLRVLLYIFWIVLLSTVYLRFQSTEHQSPRTEQPADLVEPSSGSIPAHGANVTEAHQLVPRTVHFVFGLAPDFGKKPFGLVHYLAIKSARQNIRPEQIFWYYKHLPSSSNHYWQKAKPFLTLVDLQQEQFQEFDAFIAQMKHVAHKADLYRLLILRKYGGIYLDTDMVILQPFPQSWFEEPTVLAQEGRSAAHGLCNAFIMAQPQSFFVRVWLTHYRRFSNSAL